MNIDEIELRVGKELFDYQVNCMDDAVLQSTAFRQCYYYPTGKGKTLTALATLAYTEHQECMVIAPPSTHQQWVHLGIKLGMAVQPMSHAKFRMKSTQMKRDIPVVADEFHLFGGHKGQGWKKLDALARGLRAPLILASATPNYNDAERVYCIQHVLDPHSCKGGYLAWIYQHCITEENPFGLEPKVIGFRNFADAAEMLASLPHVQYLPDELVYTITDHPVPEKIPAEMDEFGYNRRRHRMIASQIEERHARVALSLISDKGLLDPDVLHTLLQLIPGRGSVLVYANHATVAEATERSLYLAGHAPLLVTGKTTTKVKQQTVQTFIEYPSILIGTATLATGTDGMDKVCDTLIILDDTDDDALRRQLIGRIMPRGDDTDVAKKQVHRLVLQ